MKIGDVYPIASFESSSYEVTVYVLEYVPELEAVIAADPDDSYPPEPEEIEFAVFDLYGSRLYEEDVDENDDFPSWEELEEDILEEIRNYMSDDGGWF